MYFGMKPSPDLAALGLVARSTVHEVNNQMVAILGLAELLLEGLPDQAELRDDLAEIRDAGNRVIAKTRELARAARELAPLGG